MARPRVALNGAGVHALLNAPGVVKDLERRAAAVAAEARANAPVKTGAYRDSVRVETVEHPTRTVVRVVADVDHALVVEGAHGTLTRAIDAYGD